MTARQVEFAWVLALCVIGAIARQRLCATVRGPR